MTSTNLPLVVGRALNGLISAVDEGHVLLRFNDRRVPVESATADGRNLDG